MKTKMGKLLVRPSSVDRWVATENLILDQFNLKQFGKDDFDSVLDLGANIGDSTVALHYAFPKAKITAFEPNSDSFKYLQKNISLNNIGAHVTSINAAVTSSKSDKVNLFLNIDDAASSTYFNDDDHNAELVKNVNFSDLRQYVSGKTLLKIDIEGGECELMTEKYIGLIKEFKTIIFEYHELNEGCCKKILEKFLGDNDFNYKTWGSFIQINN